MRKLGLLAVLCIALCGSVFAGDASRVPLLNGVYSVAIPDGWHVNQKDDGTTTQISPSEDSSMALVITAPNIAIEDEEDFAEYAAISLHALFAEFGGGEVTGEDDEAELLGFPAILYSFSLSANGIDFEGRSAAINADGAAVVFVAMAPEEDIDDFLPFATFIIESYELDPEAIEANAETIANVSELINRQLLESLQEE